MTTQVEATAPEGAGQAQYSAVQVLGCLLQTVLEKPPLFKVDWVEPLAGRCCHLLHLGASRYARARA